MTALRPLTVVQGYPHTEIHTTGTKMELKAQVDFWDGRTGSIYIAEVEDDRWQLWEKEWGGVKWAEVMPTAALVQMAEARLRSLVLNRAA